MTTNKQNATIINLDSPHESVICQFNPGEYTIRKRNSWKSNVGKGKDLPDFEFKGGKPATLKMKLFFDTSSDGADVRLLTNRLWGIMKIKKDLRSNRGEPPRCRFLWGKIWNFVAVITNINQKFTMFLSDGTPIRATLDVTFQQIIEDDKYPFQNPTSRSEPRRTRRVQPGDRLDLIAFEEYGDADRWLDLAEANDMEDPMSLESGQILNIPITPGASSNS